MLFITFFLPAVQASLNEFVNQWNYHGLRTMQSTSPLALWYSEIIEIGATEIDIGDLNLYGIDPDDPVGDIETNNMVVVPESTVHVTDIQAREINRLVPNPLQDDGDHRISHYLTVRDYLKSQFQQQ